MPKTSEKNIVRATPYSFEVIQTELNAWKSLSKDYESKVAIRCKTIRKFINDQKQNINAAEACKIFEEISIKTKFGEG